MFFIWCCIKLQTNVAIEVDTTKEEGVSNLRDAKVNKWMKIERQAALEKDN